MQRFKLFGVRHVISLKYFLIVVRSNKNGNAELKEIGRYVALVHLSQRPT